ncbi:MAG: hypothetical protein AMXMBFR60_31970 [Chloroflexota bacterium]
MDMDISQLAAKTAKFLAPLLPFLIQGAKDAARAAFERAGEKSFDAVWKKGGELWGKLKGKVDTEQDAVKQAIQEPEDRDAQEYLAATLKFQLKSLFNEDEGLAKSVHTIITGDSSIVIGNDMRDSVANLGDGNLNATQGGQIIQTVHHHYAESKPPGKKGGKAAEKRETLSADELRRNYLNSVIADCKRARLVGLDPQAADVTRGAFSLDHLYISLDTKTQVETTKEEQKEQERQFLLGRSRPLSVLEALSNQSEGRMVLLGLPGSGKSTFVRYLSLWHAHALLDSTINISEKLPTWEGQALLPVIVPLGRLAENLPKGAKRGSAEFIEKFLELTATISAALLDQTLRDGGLFLFDGLDEVADIEARPIVVEAVENFASKYGANKKSRFLVTCRTFSYTDPRWQLTSWASHELAPLTRKKINQFIEYWHNECIAVDPARKDDYEEKRKKLHDALQEGDHRRLWEIADNPLILTVMAVVHTHKGDLPDARALVYEECIDLLLLRWEAERTVTGKSQRRDLRSALNVPDIALRNVLQEIAYHAHERERKTDGKREGQAALVTEDLLRADLFAAFQDNEKVQTFMDYCESANGLLMLQGVAPLPDAPPDAPPRRVYAFPHLTFEEYLAARYLRRMKTLGQKTLDHLTRSDRWREVVMLLGEHICFREGDYELMDSIIHALAPEDDQPKRGEDWKARWAAGNLLLLYQRAFEQRKNQHGHLSQTLVSLIEASRLTPRERTEAADTLARLGDPRPGVIADYVFCKIPAGAFMMGEDKNAIEYTISNNYFMSRYPVTNAQFEEFVKADGYKQEEYWREAKDLGGWSKEGFKGRYDSGARTEPLRFGGAFALPNHPVVGVSWYEAAAFCNWLTEKMQKAEFGMQIYDPKTGSIRTDENLRSSIENRQSIIRLPTEAEWERAARGGHEFRYPWGSDEITPDHANYDETNLNVTSAVGAFPKGRNDYGLLDMSGNVWEWCATEWQENYNKYLQKENNKPEGDVARVLRGGSYLDGGVNLRCAARLGLDPIDRYEHLGFRCVARASFPISP